MPFDYAHMVAGCVAGASSVLVSHPMDTVKVRLQTGTGYKGTCDCVTKTFRREGLYGFFKGMGFPLVAASAYNSCVFFVYQNVLAGLSRDKDRPEITDMILASMGAGAVSVSIGTPIDLIKIKLQVQTEKYTPAGGMKSGGGKGGFLPGDKFLRSKNSRNISTSVVSKLTNPEVALPGGGSMSTRPTLYGGPVGCVLDIVKTKGFMGLYRGAGAMLVRDIPGYSLYFVPYELIMRVMTPQDRRLTYGETAFTSCVAGGSAGTISWSVMHPIDTVKSRLQADSAGKYSGFLDCVLKSWKNEGAGVFLRGLGINALRGFPQSAALFLGYEMTMKVFQNRKDAAMDGGMES